MGICYNPPSKLLLALVLVVALSPLAAQEQAEEQPVQPAVEERSEEWQNWIFALGSAVAAAIGIVVVSLNNGHTAHQ